MPCSPKANGLTTSLTLSLATGQSASLNARSVPLSGLISSSTSPQGLVSEPWRPTRLRPTRPPSSTP